MAKGNDRLVDDYLGRLEKELRGLPRARRRELLDEIREHIEGERSQLDIEGEAGIRNILDRLGEPADIAAEARYRFGVAEKKRAGAVEVGALILLPIGGIVIPVVGWIIGVVLLWVSDAWSTRDKLIGTLVPPGGFVGAFFMWVVAAQQSIAPRCTKVFDAQGQAVSTACSGGGTSVGDVLLIVLAVALAIAPMVTVVYLATRIRRRRQAPDLAPSLG